MVATIKVLGDKQLKAGLREAQKVYAKERKKTMHAILKTVVIPAVQRRAASKFKKGKRFRKIAKPQARLVTLLSGSDVKGEVYPRVGFMGVFETGGTVTPNSGKRGQSGRPRKYFKIPLPGARDGLVGNESLSRTVAGGLQGSRSFLRKSKRGNLIIFRRNYGSDITPIFVLKKQITLPRRPFLGPAADDSAPTVAERFGDAYVSALRKRGL